MFNSLLSAVIPLLVFASAASTQVIQSNICSLPTSPTISSPTDGTVTSTATVNVEGTADPSTSVNILDNSQLEASITSDSSGDYESSINLSSGANNIIAQAENNCQQTANSASVNVTYNPPAQASGGATNNPSTTSNVKAASAPAVVSVVSLNSAGTAPLSSTSSSVSNTYSDGLSLHVIVPKDSNQNGSSNYVVNISNNSNLAYKTNQQSVIVSGSTGVVADIEVIVNSRVAANIESGPSGAFSVRIPIGIGPNKVVIIAKTANDQIEKTIQIQRDTAQKNQTYKITTDEIVTLLLIVILLLAILLMGNKIKGNKAH